MYVSTSESVLASPDHFDQIYSNIITVRQAELAFTLRRLPSFLKRQVSEVGVGLSIIWAAAAGGESGAVLRCTLPERVLILDERLHTIADGRQRKQVGLEALNAAAAVAKFIWLFASVNVMECGGYGWLQGVFLFGMSEGAVTLSTFNDEYFASMIRRVRGPQEEKEEGLSPKLS